MKPMYICYQEASKKYYKREVKIRKVSLIEKASLRISARKKDHGKINRSDRSRIGIQQCNVLIWIRISGCSGIQSRGNNR